MAAFVISELSSNVVQKVFTLEDVTRFSLSKNSWLAIIDVATRPRARSSEPAARVHSP